MTRKLAALLAVVLAALAAASLTVGLLYWALDSFRRKPPSREPLPAPSLRLASQEGARERSSRSPSATPPLPAPRQSSDRLPWH